MFWYFNVVIISSFLSWDFSQYNGLSRRFLRISKPNQLECLWRLRDFSTANDLQTRPQIELGVVKNWWLDRTYPCPWSCHLSFFNEIYINIPYSIRNGSFPFVSVLCQVLKASNFSNRKIVLQLVPVSKPRPASIPFPLF